MSNYVFALFNFISAIGAQDLASIALKFLSVLAFKTKYKKWVQAPNVSCEGCMKFTMLN